MITLDEAHEIAQAWINAWNTRDLDAIMAHYAEDIVFWSPLIVKRLGLESGTIQDKAQLRRYFAQGLETAPDLHFTLLKVFHGIDSIVIHYRRQNGTEAAELMVLDTASHLVIMARVHYHPPL
ncbi:MAG: DUF4440 domain-containing protein [Anaerolineaceae bacterium]|nr:DUF4440 domain-containing protein [Anaerolineaceae bacterium]